MKAILRITAFLSWFNGVIGVIFVLAGVLSLSSFPSPLAGATSIVLVSSIVLHSYAALQLRKSMMHPGIPLGRQTPIGIRFMGMVALFFALINGGNAILLLQHTPELIGQFKFPVYIEPARLLLLFRVAAVFSLLVSLTISSNAMLNFKLLKLYQRRPPEP